MKKTIGLVALLVSSAVVMVQPALASERNTWDGQAYHAPVYASVRRNVRADYRRLDTTVRRDSYRDNSYRDNNYRDNSYRGDSYRGDNYRR